MTKNAITITGYFLFCLIHGFTVGACTAAFFLWWFE
jgi:hypothetical protein